jgi:glycosyltransferase 2 family protein
MWLRSLYMSPKSRKWLLLGLLAFIVLFLLFRSRSALHLRESWHALQSADPRYLVAAVVLIYVCYFLRALRWQSLQRHVGSAPLIPIFNMTLAGFSAVYLFGRVGEPVRPLLISRKSKVPIADIFGIYALERVVDMMFAGVILGVWFLIATVQHTPNSGIEAVRRTAGTILALGVVAVAAVIVYFRLHGATIMQGRLESWLEREGWRASVARVVFGLGRGFKTIRSWRDFAYILGISTLHWFLIILVYQVIVLGFGGRLATLSLADSMLIVALTMVGSLLQLPGIGGGPQAVMTGAFTRFYGVPWETAFAASMVIFLVTFAMCSFVGAPLLFKEGMSLGELRRMREQEDKEIDSEIIAHSPGAPNAAETSD